MELEYDFLFETLVGTKTQKHKNKWKLAMSRLSLEKYLLGNNTTYKSHMNH